MPKEKSVGAIVFNRAGQKKFLLLLYGAGHWDFPKGHIEKGETEQDAMLRELEEETGITAKNIMVVPGFKESIHYFYRANGKSVFKEVFFFLVESDTSTVKLSFEHRDFKWLQFENAVEQATFKTAKQLLRKADAFLEGNPKNHE